MTICQNPQTWIPPFKRQKLLKKKSLKYAYPTLKMKKNNLNSEFTVFELNHALSSKHNSAPEADTVSYEMLKQLPDSSKKELIKLINISWERGEIPSEWKIATIIPIIKPHKDKLNPQSYRPISLTSAICKTMETMVANRLSSHLEKTATFQTTKVVLENIGPLSTNLYAWNQR